MPLERLHLRQKPRSAHYRKNIPDYAGTENKLSSICSFHSVTTNPGKGLMCRFVRVDVFIGCKIMIK